MNCGPVSQSLADGYNAGTYKTPALTAAGVLRPMFYREVIPIKVFGTYSVINLGQGSQFILDCQVITVLTNAAGTNIGTFAAGQFVEITATTDSGGFVCRGLTNTLPAVKFTTSSAASGVVPSGSDWSGASLVVWQNTTDGAMAVTTPSAAAIIAALLAAGFSSDTPYVLQIVNRGDNTVTLTAGSEVTITGENTIATLVTRDYAVTMNILLSTVTLRSLNKGTIET